MQDKRNIESVVKEIMGLVSTHAQMHRASFMGSAKENSAYRSEADKTRRKIESKLRELVREPLTLSEIESVTGAKQGTPMFLVAESFVRATEKIHNITNASGVE